MHAKLKIAVLAPYPVYPALMGGQKAIAFLYQHLGTLEEVTILSTTDNQFPSDTRCRYIPIFANNQWRYINPLLFFKLRSIFRSQGITHLIIEHPYMGWLALLCKWFLGVKLIIHSHNIEGNRFRSTGKWWWRLLWWYEKYMHRLADFNFFITDEDRQYAREKFAVPDARSATITYGIAQHSAPDNSARQAARKRLLEQYQLPDDCRLMLFNGTLSYQPNIDAVQCITTAINPVLIKQAPGPYCIFICGKDLPATMQEPSANVMYTGFVDDIQTYYLGCNLFLNPVLDGGGIKTKLVESLSANTPAVSYVNGAIGVPQTIAGAALTIVPNQDTKAFAQAILQSWQQQPQTPVAYFEHFNWRHIARKAQAALQQL